MEQQQRGNVIYPDQVREIGNQLHSIVKILSDMPVTLANLRRVFRGEVLYQDKDGENLWIQMVKPAFIRIDYATGLPLKEKKKMPWGEIKEIYIPNDEAIEEVLSMLSFMGMNQSTPFTNLSQDNILDDLKEFELKLASLLCLKQKEWGLDKELVPMQMTKIKTLIQDVRYMACEGGTIKAIQTTVQRMEQSIEYDKQIKKQTPGGPF